MKCSDCGKKVFAGETCECGVKAPNSHGFGVGISSVIFFIIVLLSTLCLIVTLSLRTIVSKDMLHSEVDELNLAEIMVNDQKLDEYILEKFIDDDRITVENVDNVLADPFIAGFVKEKLDAYTDFCMDEGEIPEITADEIIKLIEDNEDLLYNEAGLKFLEEDKEELRSNLDPALSKYNEFCRSTGDSWYFAGAVHTFFSVWNVISIAVLLFVVFVNWLIVYKLNSRRISKMLRKYSIAVLIPSFILLIGSVSVPFILKGTGADSAYDILKGFNFRSDIKMPFILYSASAAAAGAILFVLSVIFKGEKKTAAPSEVYYSSEEELSSAQTDVQNGFAENNTQNKVYDEKSAPDASAAMNPDDNHTAVLPEQEFLPGKCSNCGHQNRETAAFCSKCGTKLG
ncbi:MAG: zinc ribbon domain-containing protein [Porcipelethomonas sp.]